MFDETVKPERTNFAVEDLVDWSKARKLDISPKFQRRSVWSTNAKSLLIDTILIGLPIPPIYLRVVKNEESGRTVREVIDGQQRLTSIFQYISGRFALTKAGDYPGVAGKKFSELAPDEQERIERASIVSEVFSGIDDPTVLKIFARMNQNSVKLNAQELRNGRFFGSFKRFCYRMSYKYIEYWRQNRIFTNQSIARMKEVELVSELIVAMIDGMQDKKKSINAFYEKYDKALPQEEQLETQFDTTIKHIDENVGDFLKASRFRRGPLFYTLFCAVYEAYYDLPNFDSNINRRLLQQNIALLSAVVSDLSSGIDDFREERVIADPIIRKFVSATSSQTDNIQPRTRRLEAFLELWIQHAENDLEG